jgi:A/G-specific adenine glycosylase
MLQQTRMERGVEYFKAWMRRFPDIRSVAEAREEAILTAWEGLGYYSRARNLHAAAKCIMADHHGEFPRSLDAIQALPGVGDYTAGAIAAIAFDDPVPAVDTNIMRVFARMDDIASPLSDRGARIHVAETVGSLLSFGSPRLIIQGLMELGALVCGRTPNCGQCPVAGFCAAHRLGVASARPPKKPKAAVASLEMTAGILMRKGRVLIRKRRPGGLWGGLWEFPGGSVEPGESPEDALVRRLEGETGIAPAIREKIAVVRHGYTTNRVIVHGYLCDAAGAPLPSFRGAERGKWVRIAEIDRYAFPAGHRKLLERLGWKEGGESASRPTMRATAAPCRSSRP